MRVSEKAREQRNLFPFLLSRCCLMVFFVSFFSDIHTNTHTPFGLTYKRRTVLGIVSAPAPGGGAAGDRAPAQLGIGEVVGEKGTHL